VLRGRPRLLVFSGLVNFGCGESGGLEVPTSLGTACISDDPEGVDVFRS